MKLCIFTPMIFPVPAVRGGAVEGLVELLIRVNEEKRKFELIVVTVHDDAAILKSKQYKYTKFIFIKKNSILDKLSSNKLFIYINKIFIKLFNKTVMYPTYTIKMWNKVKALQIDFFMIEGGGDYYNFGYLKKKIKRERFGIHYHGEVSGNVLLNNWFCCHITVSNFIARKLTCNGDIDEDNIKVLRNCFDEKAMTIYKDRNSIREKYNISENEFVFVFCGRLVPEKGIKQLIEAFCELSDEVADITLLIVGNANFGFESHNAFDEKLKLICKDKIENNKIVFTGFVEHDLIGSILNACDAGVVPSIWDDPAPLTVFEGFAVGLPLIVCRVGGIPEIAINEKNSIIIDWSTGYVEEIKTQMNRVINDPELRKKISDQCRIDSKLYTQYEYYNNYYNLVKNILRR